MFKQILYGDIYVEHGPLQNSSWIQNLNHGICLINDPENSSKTILNTWLTGQNSNVDRTPEVFVEPKIINDQKTRPLGTWDVTGEKYLQEVRCKETHNACHPNCDQNFGCFGPDASDCYKCNAMNDTTFLVKDGNYLERQRSPFLFHFQ